MCSNLTLTLSVQKIVMGGGVLNRGEALLSRIRHHFNANINNYIAHPCLKLENLDSYIVRSKFTNELGIVSSAAVGSTAEVWKE